MSWSRGGRASRDDLGGDRLIAFAPPVNFDGSRIASTVAASWFPLRQTSVHPFRSNRYSDASATINLNQRSYVDSQRTRTRIPRQLTNKLGRLYWNEVARLLREDDNRCGALLEAPN
jgi:hypothetical protein